MDVLTYIIIRVCCSVICIALRIYSKKITQYSSVKYRQCRMCYGIYKRIIVLQKSESIIVFFMIININLGITRNLKLECFQMITPKGSI